MRFSITDIALVSCVLSGSWLALQAPTPSGAGIWEFAIAHIRAIALMPALAVEYPIPGAIFLVSALVVLVQMQDTALLGRSIQE